MSRYLPTSCWDRYWASRICVGTSASISLAVSAAWEAVRDRYEPFARARAPVVSRGLSRLLMAAREEGAVLHRLAWNEAEVKAEGRAPSAEVAARLARIVEQETGRTLTVKTERKAEHEFHFTMETQPSR